MCLVDDLMEPFRPAVDYAVVRLVESGCADVTPDAKRQLVGVLAADMRTGRGTTPLETCLERAAQSLAQSFEDKQVMLSFPERMIPA